MGGVLKREGIYGQGWLNRLAVEQKLTQHSEATILWLVFGRSVMSDTFATSWTVALQASLSMGFQRQEYWSRLPFPSPGDLPNPEVEHMSPISAG